MHSDRTDAAPPQPAPTGSPDRPPARPVPPTADDTGPDDSDRPETPRPPHLLLPAAGGRWAAVLALAVAASTTATLLLPALLARAVNQALAGAGTATGRQLIALLALLTAAEAAAQYAAPRSSADAASRIRTTAIRRMLAAGPAAVSRMPVGDLVARLTASAPQAALAAPALVYSAAQLLMAAVAVVALTLLSPLLSLAFLVTAPTGYAVIRRPLRRTTHAGDGYQRTQAQLASGLLDALSGSRSIAASATVTREIQRVLRPLPHLSRLGHELWDTQRRTAWCTGLLAPATQLTVLAVAGTQVAAGRLEVGDLLTALGYTGIGLSGLGTAQSLLDVAQARAGAARLTDVLTLPVRRITPRPLPAGPGRLELRGVVVHRQGAVALDGLDLTVPDGSWTALVGAPDSVTSLVAALAVGLAEPDEGTVTLDGVPLAAIHPDELPTAISCAFADPVLTGATVQDALGLGLGPAPPPSRLRGRAGRAGRGLRPPDGYRTPMASLVLSGGERQRLGLARALARDSRLIVLDDATCGLDGATEAAALHALRGETAGRTVLHITRRATVAAAADRVAWLHEGRVRTVAAHDDLWPHAAYRDVLDGGTPGPRPAPLKASAGD
ncbi:ABC transporter ATP-binding protein/permease [Streptomyces sp. NBC_01571]|uniref:ABC transporter transmembrane domain-containing protein n=1 Tax=Streptomyces sp. NBC_01571 TaxID=2975883 RepID=UPI00224CE119|nr:ABC transporter ATP-binding protein [Streptomyces sp. NBC_01571]MCX4572580.1 ABC transporter ATP-binding protein/permease [Streptomyces sp. NBC_01571]